MFKYTGEQDCGKWRLDGVNWEIQIRVNNTGRRRRGEGGRGEWRLEGSGDKFDRTGQIANKIGVRRDGPTRTYLALSHITPFVTHLFSRVSAEILTYAGHYPVQLARSGKNYCCTCRTVENRHDRTRYLQPGRFSPRKSFDRSVPLPTLLPWSITLLETVRKGKKEEKKQLLRGGFCVQNWIEQFGTDSGGLKILVRDPLYSLTHLCCCFELSFPVLRIDFAPRLEKKFKYIYIYIYTYINIES